MNILAIDPGLSGAAVLLGPQILEVRRDFTCPEDISRAIGAFSDRAHVAVIEMVAARPGQGVASMFRFGYSAGIAEGALNAFRFSVYGAAGKPLIMVTPQQWQGYFWKVTGNPRAVDDHGIKEPFDSIRMVHQFFPRGVPFLTRKLDHGTADAMLMALWYLLERPEIGALRAKDKKNLKKIIARLQLKD